MKYTKLIRSIAFAGLTGVITGNANAGSLPSAPEQSVDVAYELRMEGKADLAIKMLEAMLVEDSNVAGVWFELARAKHHAGLGNPRELMQNLEDLESTVNEAVKKDPENLTYAYYNAQLTMFCAYPSLMRQQPDAGEKVQKAVDAFEAVLLLDPGCTEALLDLVEILGTLDADMGGNASKAELYAGKLEGIDPVYATKANQFLLEKDVDRIEFWKGVLKTHPGNADVLQELGVACMMQGKTEMAVEYTESAIEEDSDKTYLLLDLARYHTMSAMRNKEEKGALLPVAEEYLRKYLATDPVPPLKAYAIEVSARIKWMQDDKVNAEKLREQAKTLDPFYSKGTGVPSMQLFSKPGESRLYHNYWTRPF